MRWAVGSFLVVSLGCTSRPPSPPAPSRPVESRSCLSPTDPASVAAALRDELLLQAQTHPPLAGLTAAMMRSDPLHWWIVYGEREVPNEDYEEELQAYEAEMRRREEARARGEAKHWHPIHEPSRTKRVLASDGLRLRCEFGSEDPRFNWSRSEAVVDVRPVEGGEIAELHDVWSPYFGERFVRIGETFVVYESSQQALVTASLLTLAHRVAACR